VRCAHSAVTTTSELTARNRADAIFEGKVESVELGWKLKEAQIGDVIPTVATARSRIRHSGSSNIFSQRNGVQLRQPPAAGCGEGDVDEREPTFARVHNRGCDEWLFVFNNVLPGEYWAIVTVDPSVESKWSTRKARVEVVGDTTHLSLELIAN
jgi:hypothetical protein